MTTLSGLSVSRDGRSIVAEVTLNLAPGGLSVIVGPSGAGKTSLLMAVCGIGPNVGLCVEGRLQRVDGEAIPFNSLVRPLFSLVPQNAVLFDDLSVGENIDIVTTAHANHNLNDFALIERLLAGIDPAARPNTLSGGQRQRVAIVRSLLTGSKIIVMDEPNAGLDQSTTSDLVHLIDDLRDEGIHIVVAAHHPAPFLQNTGQVYFLNDGKLLEIPFSEDAISEAFHNCLPSHQLWKKKCRFELQKHTHIYWIKKFVLRDLWGHALSPTNLLYIGAACALIAFTLGFVSVTRYPFSPLLFDVSIERVTSGLGNLFYRFTVPLFVGLLIAARSGSLATTDLLQKQYSGATLSLLQLRVPIRLYQRVSLLVGIASGCLVLYLFALIISLHALVLAVSLTTDLPEPVLRSYVVADFLFESAMPPSWHWVSAKIIFSGIIVAIVSFVFGSRIVLSGEEIKRTGAASVLTSVLSIIGLQSVIILLELQL